MAKHLFLHVILILLAGYAASPALAQADTTLYQLKEVQVFGRPAEVYAVGSRVETLDSAYIKANAFTSLGNVLQELTPIYVKQYGPGGISTVTFRGSSAQHTAVLWNGLNIASPSLGQSDLSLLPLSGVGSIAVQHGGASAVYGSGAIGGAVLLGSPEYSDGLQITAQQGFGSFGQYSSRASLGYGNNKISAGVSFFWQKAENNFPFYDLSQIERPLMREEHAAIQRKGFTQDLTWRISRRGKLSLHSWYTESEREIQPAIGANHSNAAYKDRNLRIMADYEQLNWLGEASLKAAYLSDHLQYTSSNLTSVTAIETYQAQAGQTYVYGRRWSLKGGANLQHFIANVEGYGRKVTENRGSVFLLTRFDPTEHVSLSLNIRQAFADGYNPPPAPAFGINWKVLGSQQHQLAIKGNIAGSYRLPTMNERYWQPGGDPDLKPEQGYQAEAGLEHIIELQNFRFETEVTPYIMQVNNWVEWRTAGGVSTPVNLQQVRSQGVEFSSNFSKTMNNWMLKSIVGYTYASSRQVASTEESSVTGNQLAYVPLHKATWFSRVSYRDWFFTANALYNSKRYTSGSNTTALDSFALLDLGFGRTFRLGSGNLQAALEVNNLTNTTYQTMQNYAMPLRNYQFQINYSISNKHTTR